jgi:hypothetical protein
VRREGRTQNCVESVVCDSAELWDCEHATLVVVTHVRKERYGVRTTMFERVLVRLFFG